MDAHGPTRVESSWQEVHVTSESRGMPPEQIFVEPARVVEHLAASVRTTGAPDQVQNAVLNKKIEVLEKESADNAEFMAVAEKRIRELAQENERKNAELDRLRSRLGTVLEAEAADLHAVEEELSRLRARVTLSPGSDDARPPVFPPRPDVSPSVLQTMRHEEMDMHASRQAGRQTVQEIEEVEDTETVHHGVRFSEPVRVERIIHDDEEDYHLSGPRVESTRTEVIREEYHDDRTVNDAARTIHELQEEIERLKSQLEQALNDKHRAEHEAIMVSVRAADFEARQEQRLRELEQRLANEEHRRSVNVRAIRSGLTEEEEGQTRVEHAEVPQRSRESRETRHERYVESSSRDMRSQREQHGDPDDEGWVTIRHIRRVHRSGDQGKRHARTERREHHRHHHHHHHEHQQDRSMNVEDHESERSSGRGSSRGSVHEGDDERAVAHYQRSRQRPYEVDALRIALGPLGDLVARFSVNFMDTPSAARSGLSGPQQLLVSCRDIRVYSDRMILRARWPLSHVKRYGKDHVMVCFEIGRVDQNPGFFYVSTNLVNELFYTLDSAVRHAPDHDEEEEEHVSHVPSHVSRGSHPSHASASRRVAYWQQDDY